MAQYTPDTYFLNPAHEVIASSRYYLKGPDGTCVEKNIFETFKRVNSYVFQNDPEHLDLAQRLCEEKKFMYAGRPLAQAGTGIENMFNCYSKDVPVVTYGGVLPISTIQIGDYVLTEDGTFQKVLNKFSQGYREKLLRVKVDRMPNVLDVTPDHKILTRRGWVEASELTSGDYVSVPGYRGTEEVPKSIKTLDYVHLEELGNSWALEIHDGFIYQINEKKTSIFGNNYSAKTNPVRSEIPVSDDLAKLLGYYISVGCVSSSGNTVLFTYHVDEKEYINETKALVERLFGVSANIHSIKGQKCTQVRVNSKIVNNFFKNWIGPTLDKKILPWWVLNTTIEFQRLVLAYACRGDAHIKETGQASLTMCNPHTMMQMFFIAQKLGLAYSFKYGSKKKEHYAVPVILNIAHDRAQSGEFLEFAGLVDRFIPDNRYWRRVVSVDEIDYNDNVWDISVDTNHSLQIAGMVGSNCFVLGIDDSREDISECQRIHFHIQAHGGGTGINFSKLRPSGAWCKGANARSSGPEGFITAMSYLSSNIQQGGNRSGANMGILEDWHPGLLNFITNKSRNNWENIRRFAVIANENLFKRWQWVNPYSWQTFNVSVGLSDDFMRQVKRKSNKPWHLKWKDQIWMLWDFEATLHDFTPTGEVIDEPILITVVAPDAEIALHEAMNQVPFRNASSVGLKQSGKPYELTALEWFERICTNAWEDGCPGIFFIDRARDYHNGEYFNPVDATNPCYAGDQHLLTSVGYRTFKELYDDQEEVMLVQDARVTYSGPEKDQNNPAYWSIDPKIRGYVVNKATPVFLTKKSADLVKVMTCDGLELRCTPDHHLAVLDKGMVEAKDLAPDDRILVADTPIISHVDKYSLDYVVGMLYGLFLGDGHVNTSNTANKVLICLWGEDREQYLIVEKMIQRLYDELGLHLTFGGNGRVLSPYFVSNIPDKNELRIESNYLKKVFEHFGIFDGNNKYSFTSGKLDKSTFFAGLFSGLFFTDGTVGYNKKNKNLSVRFCSSNLDMLKLLQREALVYGAFGRIYKCRGGQAQDMPNGLGSHSQYFRKASYELIFSGIARERLVSVMDLMGTKALKYGTLRATITKVYRNFWSKVSSVVPDGKEDVYCLTENNRRTVVVNGITGRRCAEQILPQWSVCCLSSLVLPEFVTEGGTIDWEALKEATVLGVRALNHITLLNKTGIEKIDKNTQLERRIGLGTIGMHELLIRVALRSDSPVKYSNDEGRALARKILKFIKHAAYEASIDLSSEIGPFPAFDYEGFTRSKFTQQLLKERPDLDEKLKKQGIANVTVLTQAPTGCQSPDTLVATDQGILTLGELVDSNGQTWQPHKLRVLQEKDSYLYSSRGFVNGQSPTKKITLESGITLESTPNHQYRVFSSDGEYLWRPASALKPGDVVASRIGGYTKVSEPILNANVPPHFNHQDIKLPNSMFPEFAKFLGMYFADGSNHTKGVRIHLNANEGLENDGVAELIESLFGIYPGRIISRGCESLYINSTRLLRFLELNGLSKQKSRAVEIPKVVRQSSAASLQAFLDGYTYCDGSTSSYTHWIDTTSPNMAQQLAVCMRLLGTNSVIQTLANREAAKGDRPLYRIKKLNFGSADFDEAKSRYITRERKDWRAIANSQNKNLHFDVVKVVEDSTNLTLDIEVPETETYIANSIVSHNTTGTITGYSSGCEPYFAMAYIRNSNIGTILDGCPSFIDWLKEKDINYEDYNQSLKELRKHKRVPKVFEEAQEISWEDHLKMQAIFAEQVDSSVSKTINLPQDASVKDIMDAYVSAYDMNIKSTTVYRDGSKIQILETMQGALRTEESLRPKTILTLPAPKRPETLRCDIHTVSVKGEKWKVLLGLMHGRPYEIFCFPEDRVVLPTTKHEGVLVRLGNGRYTLEIPYGEDKLAIKDIASLLLTDEHRMITRLLSTGLRHGAPLSALADQLSKCDGDVTAFSKAIMRVLRKYISEDEHLDSAICNECGSRNLIMQDGCLKCADCGFSGCS